ncbi:triphosphoribosyl-dephospho-CoA synthase CitG [Pasteurella multocida]|uniref:triphosphoribosyl-dephospho-CoA synthase CitG n=1 Tax=Pasteurella multocida TaxID=747 RepID=UPI002B46F01C|nr:triphosphoribosyl-dephospho-CoA synthase CitG [Pasteurella multocida]MEB3475442.1 triphosphoribosyl-dephospho-CoA synthase CitG [Pasteurella multocida]MEB3506893.1 triphosphoribosyl-dephospho-CoA synthase CitG [Pasteurella multocida]WRJ98070.1 triphosphoribosyl-dephospho-CoA synthase CitG [Pasteurella multocida]
MLNKLNQILSLSGKKITLLALLEARDNRAALQRECLDKYGKTLLSLTLVAVGEVKKNALFDAVFEKSLEKLTALFEQLNLAPIASFIRPLETGHEAIFVLPVDPILLKRSTIELEESLPLARLWDIDVIDAQGKVWSRTELGFAPRQCLLCDENAKICARSRQHSVAHILYATQRLVAQHQWAAQVGEWAYQALLEEARLTPKPSLVDSANSGSHRDMDLSTFQESAVALRPFLVKFVELGMATCDITESELLPRLRPLGQQAEQAMLHATLGVNAHKGAIFSFGLVCAMVGRWFAQQLDLSAQPLTLPHFSLESMAQVCEGVALCTKGICQELSHYPVHLPVTAGVRLFRQYGLKGARGEAEQGFPLIRKYFPASFQQSILQKSTFTQEQWEHQLLILLLRLISENEDTNVVNRGGLEGLNFMQQHARWLLQQSQTHNDFSWLKAYLIAFDNACIEKNLSAGGSADLLALSIFFYFLILER